MRTTKSAFFIFMMLFSLGNYVTVSADSAPFSPELSATAGSLTLRFHGPLGEQSIVLRQEEALFSLTIDTPFSDRTLHFAYTVYDRYGEEQQYDEETWQLSGEIDTFTYDLHSLNPGWYRLLYTLHQPGHEQPLLQGQRDFVVLRGRGDIRDVRNVPYTNAFGLQNDRLTHEEARIAYELGAHWVLDASVQSWAETQLHPEGQYVFRLREEERSFVKQYDLHPIGSVHSLPAWVETDNAFAALRNQYYEFLQSYPYHDETKRYAITEPFNSNAVSPSLVRMQMKLTAAALQSNDPDQQGKHIVSLRYDELDKVNALLRDGVQYHTDVLLVHLPPLERAPEQFPWEELQLLQRQWHQAGGYAELWTMMPNASLYEKTEPTPPLNTRTTFRLFHNPTPIETVHTDDDHAEYDGTLQEQWLVRSHILQLANGVDRIFSGPLSTGDGERRLYSGGAGAFPDVPQRPRPALAAYAVLVDQLGDAVYLGQLTLGPDIHAHLFSRQGRFILTVWTTRASTSFELSNLHTNEVTIVDTLGAEQSVTVQNGRLEVQLTESPQYVVGLDASILAQVLIDSFTTRLVALRNMEAPWRNDIEQAIDDIRQLATEVWLHSAGLSDSNTALNIWMRSVQRFVAIGEQIIRDTKERTQITSVLVDLLDMWPVLAEIGSQLDIEQDGVSAQEQQAGTEAIWREAVNALPISYPAYGARYDTVAALLDKVETWWYKAQQRTEEVPAAWAMMTREALGLIALLRDYETPRRHDMFVVPEEDVIIFEATPEHTIAFTSLFQSVWNSIYHLAQAHALPLTDIAYDILEHGVNLSSAADDEWDVISTFVHIVNVSYHDIEAYLHVAIPEGWLVQVEHTLTGAKEETPTFPIHIEAEQDKSVEIKLFIPADATWEDEDIPVEISTLHSKGDKAHVTIKARRD